MNQFSSVRSRVTVRLSACLAALMLLPMLAMSASPAAGASNETVTATVTGHGWGHGRGLGQYGAQGYALGGWSVDQIVGHYYSNTTWGTVASMGGGVNAEAMRVELRANRGEALRVSLSAGTMKLYLTTSAGGGTGAGGAYVPVTDGGGNELAALSGAVRMSSLDGQIVVQNAPTCSGPWVDVATVPAAGVEVRAQATAGAGASDSLLRVCNVDGSSTWYQGTIRAHNVNNSTRAVNVVTLETYLKGVVPNEVPASWAPAALQAQAVAARSYVAAGDTRQQPYADTCDTTLCQVYRGSYRQTTGFIYAATHANTTAAIDATAGRVRIMPNGTVARTEFSSSTGGYTAGGTFPSVVDEGDSTSTNPNHDWSATIDLTAYEAQQGLGRLVSVSETGRNGLGEDGGRVTQVTFTFENGTDTMTGNEARSTFGMKSDWFTFGALNRTFADESIPLYIEHIYQMFLGRSATGAEISHYGPSVASGSRWELTEALAVTDEWAGVMVEELYETALGRSSESDGRAHWVNKIANGMRVEFVGAEFYGSAEYYTRSGGNDRAFIAELYQDLLGRQADTPGLDFWVQEMANGKTKVEVALGFYSSVESRGSRVTALYQTVLGRNPDSGGHAYWTEKLLTTDDVRLASELAASAESFERSLK